MKKLLLLLEDLVLISNIKTNFILKGSEYEPLAISLEDAKIHIENKIKQEKERIINFFDGEPAFYILNGRYGFVQVIPKEGKKINLRIPKDTVPKSLKRKKIAFSY